MLGQMMQLPLLISSLIVHAERHHGEQEVVSRRVEGDIHRTTYREMAQRSRQMAKALGALGVKMGDRVATLAWNGHRHMELYYAVSGSGAVLHTLNPRLHPDQIVYIADHAEDQVLCFDMTFLPLIQAVCGRTKTVKHWVAMTSRAHMPADAKIPNLLCYEDLLEAQDDRFEWPSFDENTASSLCYTSGTTGNPKGVLYSHRSTVLHTFAISLPDALNVAASDSILPVVPMFHVNAWGLPYAACMNGAKLVFPGPGLDGKSLYELFESEKVTCSAGVPTVWQGAAGLRRSQQAQVQHHAPQRHRRLGLPRGHAAQVRRRVRRARAARLGHDRDEPGGHRGRLQAAAQEPVGRRALRRDGQAGPRGLRRGHQDRRSEREGTGLGHRGLGRRDGQGPVDRQPVLQERGRRPPGGRLVPHRRRGPLRHRRLHADHRPQRRTSSRAAASGSAASTSRTSPWPTPPWPWPPASPPNIRSGTNARCWW